MAENKEVKKISNDHLSQLQALVSDINKINLNIGSLEIRKFGLLGQAQNVDVKLVELQKVFSEEYGSHDIDVRTGEILESKDGKTN